MLRRIATVALIIGSATALLIGSSTYAPFSDDASGSGDVEAGSVLVTINGSNEPTLNFDTDECTNMAPGHPCEVDLTVLNAGTLSATWAPSVSIQGGNGCFTATTAIPTGVAEDGDDDADIDPDDPATTDDDHNSTLTVSVSDDGDDSNDNACQRAQATVTLSVVATQSPSPYN